jgi:hypothetical protein
MHVHPRKLDKLKKRIQQVLKHQDLKAHRNLLKQICSDLNIDPADCAAGLLYASQPHLFQSSPASEAPQTALPREQALAYKLPNYRNVRYRLDIGNLHQIDREQLLNLLVEESGVDRNRIGRVDIRDSYTLVDLPDGMPADIFQLLSEATINGQRLNIKRVKPNRKKPRDMRRGGEQAA